MLEVDKINRYEKNEIYFVKMGLSYGVIGIVFGFMAVMGVMFIIVFWMVAHGEP